jgi:hypothetical protein
LEASFEPITWLQTVKGYLNGFRKLEQSGECLGLAHRVVSL